MFIKLYETILDYIKKEYKFLLVIVTLFLLMTIKLPFYIDMPGGIINISDRITIDNKKKLKGTMNFAYVSEVRATIPTYLLSKINNNWDILDKEEIMLKNETEEDMKNRDILSLKEAVSNALYIGFKEANEPFEIKNKKTYVKYVFENAKTNLKIADQILELNNNKIASKQDLKNIDNYEIGTIFNIKVLNNEKQYERTAELIEINGEKKIGIGIGETFDIDTEHYIDINYKARESGPSGGMMMALTVYSYLTEEDLTNGKKIVGTGTIDENGNVGSIGGVKYKLIGAVKNKADIFLVPNGENYDEAMKVKQEKNYNIKIVGVSTLKEAIKTLKNDK